MDAMETLTNGLLPIGAVLGAILLLLLGVMVSRLRRQVAVQAEEIGEQRRAFEEKNRALHEAYQDLEATEEELRAQFDEITEQQRCLQESDERYQLVLRVSNELVWGLDLRTGVRTFSTENLKENARYLDTGDDFSTWFAEAHPDDRQKMVDLFQSIRRGERDQGVEEFRHLHDGDYHWFLAKVVGKRNAAGELEKMAGSYALIDEKKRWELGLYRLAYYDHLTGLGNRSALMRRLDELVEDRRRFALIYLDFLKFREINSSFGHAAGDELIKAVSERLLDAYPSDMLFRINGPEYCIVCPECADGNRAQEATRLLNLFELPFHLDEQEVFLTPDVGVAVAPRDGDTGKELFRNADTALDRAKAAGGARIVFYDEAMTNEVHLRIAMSNELRFALDRGEFEVYYQPLVELTEESVVGFEALLRWRSPHYGLVSPARFIPIAEETGLIHRIDLWVLAEACDFIRRSAAEGVALNISVNMSAEEIVGESFIPDVLDVVRKVGVPCASVGLELTETSLVRSFDLVVEKLAFLKEKGFEIKLDDFGTGFSSLNYLGQLPIDTIKVDKSFVGKIMRRKNEFFLIKSVMNLARDLGMQTVVEGVEDAEQLQVLRELECPVVQGYYFSRPLPEKEALAFLRAAERRKGV